MDLKGVNQFLRSRGASAWPVPQPSALFREDISKKLRVNEYVVSYKADGTRMLVCVCGDEVTAVNKSTLVPDLGAKFPRKCRVDPSRPTILDAEFVEPRTFFVFDALAIIGEDVRHLNLDVRREKAQWCIDGISSPDKCPYAFEMKPVWPASEARSVYEDHKHEADGVIFTPVRHPLRSGTDQTVLKWKPDNTVDFFVRPMLRMPRNEEEMAHPFPLIPSLFSVYELCVHGDGGARPVAELARHRVGDLSVPGVYEFSWTESGWKPIRFRGDKKKGNSEWVYERTLRVISENVSLNEICPQ